MPRFSDAEKEIIKGKLLAEGERLFVAYGVKKVTVDDLVQAAGIAKGSFYAFYTNKEHLYMDIIEQCQMKLWQELDDFLENHNDLKPKELTKQSFCQMLNGVKDYPILVKTDSSVISYLQRKLPQDVLAAHVFEDSKALAKLQEYGVLFAYELPVVAKALQALYVAIAYLQQEGSDHDGVINLMLDSLIEQIVRDNP
ncbi:transcriptional regulator [Desulfitobacterium dehalogenans ATCC 51507]|uniref:Transcriptional regulator n=1 Tax=Desulfitobacterium dehalogenans (strain ATCC 51507 / DSM 9161 / JW/IU-DC1) TaxID=756499 RepID=I4A7S5_DESDJ|nr:TetR/AcrR family transcriptional regulator [Desulfitobacterium dehalogenans]AFM00010.1 transcriptional regulator [Desulfitobacterium dehalogenans ATCC 51507]